MATYRTQIHDGLFIDIDTYPGTSNVEGNYTPVTVQVYLRTTWANVNANAVKYGSLNIDGANYDFQAVIGSLGQYSSRLLYETSKNVYHNSDGTKRLYVSCTFGLNVNYSGNMIYAVSVEGSDDLTTIPRASTPSVTGTLELGSTITINISRAVESFIHNIYVSWGSQIQNKRIATGIGTSTTWTIPKDYANYIPNGASGTLFIICETYNAKNDNLTLIGNKTTSVTIKVPNTEEFKPSVSGVNISENSNSGVPQSWGVYVQHKSKIDYDVTAAGAYGSTIKSYKVVVNGTTYNKKTYTTDYLVLNGTNTINVTVTDSRGKTASYSKTFEVLEYNGPNITNFTSDRCLEDGTLDDEGEFVKIEINAIVPKLNNKNSYSHLLKYKKNEDEQYSNYDFTIDKTSDNTNYILSKSIILDADGDYGFDYVFTLTDLFMSINESADIDEVFQLINYHESGTGIAFGTVSKRTNALEFALPMYDRFDQLIPNGLAEYENGTIDANTTLSHLCLAQYNTPNNGFYYVMTLFYGGKELTSNRTQIAVPYIYSIDQNKRNIYIRQYIDGQWNEWKCIGQESKVLYDNTSGTEGGFTLNDSYSNYSRLEIIHEGGTVIWYPSSPRPYVQIYSYGTDELTLIHQVKTLRFSNGTTVTADTTRRSYAYSGTVTNDDKNYIKVYKVIGYK